MDSKPVPAITEIKRFYSKRNTVFFGHLQMDGFPRTAVVKQHRREAEAQREEAVLKELNGKGVRVPLPYGRCGRILLLPYLEGPLLTELLEIPGKDLICRWTDELAQWFWSLHRLSAGKTGSEARLKGDVNPRNFIFYREQFWGLDFEDDFYGPPRRDIGEMCAFILSNRPSFTADKIEAAVLFARCYLRLNNSVTGEEIEEETAAALKRMAGRRRAESKSINNFLKDSWTRKLLH